MTKSDLEKALDWAAKEGWNPGIYDADCFYNTDRNGFFMGFLDEKPISCISAIRYGDSFGFIGLYIVNKQYRGKGYGLLIWNHAMKYLKGRNIGLDGVVAQQENYKKSGFNFAYNNVRYEFLSKKLHLFDSTIVQISSISAEKLNLYDKQFIPIDRKLFLSCWIAQPESITLVSIKNNQIQGYGMIRKCHTGYKIGPLFGQNFEVADTLFQSLTGSISQNSPVFLDIPQINKSAVKLVTKFSMQKGFSTARMYTKTPPKLPLDKVFGVTTLEIG